MTRTPLLTVLAGLVAVAGLSIVTAQDLAPDGGASVRAANKQLLLDFFAFTGTREERREQFLADDYVQHNPRFLKMDEITGATGGQAWVAAWEPAGKLGIQLVALQGVRLSNPILLIAEDDLVTAIYRGDIPDPNSPGETYEGFAFETFRVRDGKFTEHWDQVPLAPGWMEPAP